LPSYTGISNAAVGNTILYTSINILKIKKAMECKFTQLVPWLIMHEALLSCSFDAFMAK
jgi:hypothetical protein